MKRFVEGMDRGQSTLFPECLEDWICKDNPVRVIDVFVGGLDLAELRFCGVDPEANGLGLRVKPHLCVQQGAIRRSTPAVVRRIPLRFVEPVSWAAYLRRMHLEGAWLAFLGYAWPPYILSALAIAELISDQLPKTPSRKVPMQYGARVVTGAGAALGASRGAWIGGLVAGPFGAVAGTLGGYEFRTRLVAAIGGKDLPTALLEDVIAIGGAVLIVMSFS